jgi:hypothetical protein
MKRIYYLIFLFVLTGSILAAVRPQIQAFYGELSPLMRLRSDFSKYDSGCVKFQNAIPLSQGPAFRRPGLKYIATSPGPYPELICDYTSPTISSEPADTALSGDTDITTRAGFASITGANHYELLNDLDLTGSWTPIADFNGVLEGNGYTLSNLTIDSSSNNQGLFANFLSNAEIRNLILKDFDITGASHIAGLVGDINEVGDITIKNVRIEDSTIDADEPTVRSGCIGGIVGRAADTYNLAIIRCAAIDCTIIENQGYSGGIIGYAVHDGSSSGDIRILNCTTSGEVSSQSCYSGGIAGWLAGKGSADHSEVHSCNSSMRVYGNEDLDDGNLNDVDGETDFGGLLGNVQYCDVTDCYATGPVNDDGEDRDLVYVGGFAGQVGSDCNIVNCYSTGDVTLYGAPYTLGGFIGGVDSNNTDIIHCYSTGDVTIYNHDDDPVLGRIGGFIGIIGSGNSSDYGLIQQCWSLGNLWFDYGVNGGLRNGVGGFIGTGGGGTAVYMPDISDCYTKSSIAVGDDAVGFFGGGFIGEFASTAQDDWDIDNCYAQNVLPADATVSGGQLGGFTGEDSCTSYDVNDTNCFWDTEISGVTTDY